MYEPFFGDDIDYMSDEEYEEWCEKHREKIKGTITCKFCGQDNLHWRKFWSRDEGKWKFILCTEGRMNHECDEFKEQHGGYNQCEMLDPKQSTKLRIRMGERVWAGEGRGTTGTITCAVCFKPLNYRIDLNGYIKGICTTPGCLDCREDEYCEGIWDFDEGE